MIDLKYFYNPILPYQLFLQRNDVTVFISKMAAMSAFCFEGSV